MLQLKEPGPVQPEFAPDEFRHHGGFGQSFRERIDRDAVTSNT